MDTQLQERILARWLKEGWRITKSESDPMGDTHVVFIEREFPVSLVFVLTPISAEYVSLHLTYATQPVMFMVDADLIDDQPFEPEDYLLALHSLYYGRVYTFRDDGSLWGVHFERDEYDYDVRIPSWSRTQPTMSWDFLVVEAESWLHWFPGKFRVARPYDKKWWNVTEPPPREKREQSAWGQAQHPQSKDPWTVLGVGVDATRADIKSAYRKRAKVWHPDINKAPEATERMKEINAAYEKLQQWVTA